MARRLQPGFRPEQYWQAVSVGGVLRPNPQNRGPVRHSLGAHYVHDQQRALHEPARGIYERVHDPRRHAQLDRVPSRPHRLAGDNVLPDGASLCARAVEAATQEQVATGHAGSHWLRCRVRAGHQVDDARNTRNHCNCLFLRLLSAEVQAQYRRVHHCRSFWTVHLRVELLPALQAFRVLGRGRPVHAAKLPRNADREPAVQERDPAQELPRPVRLPQQGDAARQLLHQDQTPVGVQVVRVAARSAGHPLLHWHVRQEGGQDVPHWKPGGVPRLPRRHGHLHGHVAVPPQQHPCGDQDQHEERPGRDASRSAARMVRSGARPPRHLLAQPVAVHPRRASSVPVPLYSGALLRPASHLPRYRQASCAGAKHALLHNLCRQSRGVHVLASVGLRHSPHLCTAGCP
mmetsp:Transcript_2885/g.8816  ORF Transcript_2885/g.8816 Transcript_2885/m.8816 type:complete len:403 (+) Transcript_2885:390-1598(+)